MSPRRAPAGLPSDVKRIAQLDGVRGIAILLVLIWHYAACQVVAAPASLAAYGTRALSLTWSGVDLFFVLSGFLIAGTLLDNRAASNYFRVFYIRRVCRIFPLYFLLLAVFIALDATAMARSPRFAWLFLDPFPLWSYATFTQNVLMGQRGDYGPMWLGVTWSLAVEEQFYLFVPLLIYVLPRRALLLVLAAAVLAAPVLRHVVPGFHAFVNTPWRADSLLSGAALAVLVRSPPFLSAVGRHRRMLIVTLGALLAGAAVMTLRPAPVGSANHLWLAGLYGVFILIAFLDAQPLIGRVLRLPVLVWLGQLSYGIYMCHQAVSGLLHGVLRRAAPEMRTLQDAGVTLTALAVTLLLALVSFHAFERPIVVLGHRFRYAPAPSTTPTPESTDNARS